MRQGVVGDAWYYQEVCKSFITIEPIVKEVGEAAVKLDWESEHLLYRAGVTLAGGSTVGALHICFSYGHYKNCFVTDKYVYRRFEM
jgi:hypothetical protein